MSQKAKSPITLIAGEDLAAFRRVKLSAERTVVYADQSDSDAYIGITEAAAVSGDPVAVALKGSAETKKAVASEALAVNAVLYAADDGKVSDTASGTRIGTALEAATADGDVIEIVEDYGGAAQVDGASTSVEAEDSNGAIPIIFAKTGITDASTPVDIVASLPYKIKVIDWWVISRDTTAANVKITDGTNDITANKAKGTADDAVVRGGTIVAEDDECAAASALKAEASTAAAFDIFVMAIRVA